MRISPFFVLLFLTNFFTYAQKNTWSIQLIHSSGFLLKHSNKMLYKPDGLTQFFEMDLSYHTLGIENREKIYGLPRMGIGLRYLNLGQPTEILGTGISFFPFMDFGFFERKKSSIRFLIGCGFAYLNQPYHIKYNPSQTAIGSHWNNLSTFQCKYEYRFNKSHFLSSGISFSHISNGAFKAPNLGLNFLSALIGYSYHFQSTSIFRSSQNTSDTSFYKVDKTTVSNMSNFSYGLEYGMSLKEAAVPGGPKFLIQWYMIDIGYQYNEYKSWRLGIEVENNNIESYFASFSETSENKKAASSQKWRINTYLSHQWILGNIALCFRSGYQFNSMQNVDLPPIVSKLDLCYLIPFKLMHQLRPYLGFSLKAHLDTASYIGLMAGVRLHKSKFKETHS